ncbi:MAG: restriction endonuclease subunit S, partial [Opitutaceae bacterium]|nr:restriction endonuclease subunit S [Opitutaceae bacterium]
MRATARSGKNSGECPRPAGGVRRPVEYGLGGTPAGNAPGPGANVAARLAALPAASVTPKATTFTDETPNLARKRRVLPEPTNPPPQSLPEGWQWVTLGYLVDRLQYGYTAKSLHASVGPYFLRITDIKPEGVNWSSVPRCFIEEVELEKYQLVEGDFVFARSGSIEKAWCVESPPNAVFASYLIRGCLKNAQHREWLKYFIRSHSYLTQIGAAAAGTGMQNVNAKRLGSVLIPLPPLAEQRRIVARLETLMARSRRARAKLAEVPTQLAQARQSLLASAFRGDLTADWRRIRTPSGKGPTSDAEAAWRIPSEWRATLLENLIPDGGLFDGPFGTHLKSDDYTADGVRVIRLDNIGHLSFDEEKRTFIGEAKYTSLKRHTVGAGDLIFASFIFEPLRVCILPPLPTPAIAKADCFCLRPDPKLVDREFLCF